MTAPLPIRKPLTTPVVLLVFNRPEHTRRLLAALRVAQPAHVFIVADGPRPEVADDAARCAEVRALCESEMVWPAEVQRDFAKENLGLRRRVSSGLDWVFTQAEEAIILEDDCIPHPSFFPFCAELLARYREDERVGVVTGDNFQPQPFVCEASYYFSKYPHCWGWATWRRAWRHFDNRMALWPELRDSDWLGGLFANPSDQSHWRTLFDSAHAGTLNSWAFPWVFACWAHTQLTATPQVNLVQNIGFGAGATHTVAALSPTAESAGLDFPLTHPVRVGIHQPADEHVQRHHFAPAPPRQGWRARFARFKN